MTIPDAQLIYVSSGTIPNTAGGQPPAIGYVSDSVTGWDFGFPGPTEYLFDIYEGGSPMVDGRVFQVTSVGSNCDEQPAFAVGPSSLVPLAGSGREINNFPVMFLHNTTDSSGLQTCFYNDGIDALFFNGAFFLGSPLPGFWLNPGQSTLAMVPRSMIPLIIDPADAVAGHLVGNDSSVVSWCLASSSSFPALVPLANSNAIADIGVGVNATDARLSVVRYDGQTSSKDGAVANPTNGHFNNPAVMVCAQRCYRRGATHATYDWPGYST